MKNVKAYPNEGLDIIEVLNKPRNRFYVYVDKGLFIVLFLIVLLLISMNQLSDLIVDIFSIFLILYFSVYIFYIRLGNLFRSENIAYNTIGKLYFNNDYIQILNKQINLVEIQNIEIKVVDFEGKSRFNIHLYYPIISLGINNFITIRYKNRTVEHYQFKLMYDTQLYDFRKELVHYYKLGLVRELNIHEILGNHSFESKKNFRKHNPKYNTYSS